MPPQRRLKASLRLSLQIAALLLAGTATSLHAQKQPVNTLAEFGPLDGRAPVSGLTAGPGGFVFGVTPEGGQNRDGTVFRFKGAAGAQILVSFADGTPAPGAKPSGPLLRAPDGHFYGVCENGGANGHGALVRITAKGVVTLVASFDGANTGSRPEGTLARDKAGNFYGVCREGGPGGHGTVFKMAKNGTLTRLAAFTNNAAGTLGRKPVGGLILAGSDLYGVTEEGGGSGGHGAVYKITTAGVYALIHAFTASGPRRPVGGLVRAGDGSLYGVTQSGTGAESPGVIFRASPSGPLEVVKVFTGTDGDAPGMAPAGALVLGPGGALYGTTMFGGTFNLGVVFRMTTSGDYSLLAEFTGQFGSVPGQRPMGRLLVAGNRLLGVTREGGEQNQGTIFEVTTAGVFKSLHAFRDTEIAGGFRPAGPLARGTNGSWYGVTRRGGQNGISTIFQMTAKGQLSRLLTFTGISGAHPGADPRGGLVTGPDGRFYGTTYEGGAFSVGTVFAVTPQGNHTVLFEFSIAASENGTYPESALIPAADGRLVGTTRSGGTGNAGVVYAISTTGDLEVLANFNSIGTLARDIMQTPSGDFYGVFDPTSVAQGGLFKLTSGGALSTLVSFTGASGDFPGSTPQGAPVLMPDGKLYGVTQFGGSANRGVIYRVTPTGDYEVLRHITSAEGSNPVQGLTLANDGWLYGLLAESGASNRGCVFRVNMDGDYERLKRWAPHEGQIPGGPLVSDLQGQLFGVTERGGRGSAHRGDGQGGPTGAGVVYRVDPRVPIPLPQVTVLPPVKLKNRNPFANRWEADFRARVNPRGFATEVSFGTIRNDGFVGGQGSVNLPAANRTITVTKPADLQQATGFTYVVQVTATNEFGSTTAEWSPLQPFNIPPTVQDLVMQAPAPATPTVIYDVDVHTSDPDGAPRTLSILSYNGTGTVTTDGSQVTYTGAPFTGTELVAIQVDDGGGARVTGYVTLVSGAPLTQFLALGSTKGGVGSRVGNSVSSTHSFGTPTQFGDRLISYSRLFFDTSGAGAKKPRWQNFPMIAQINPPWDANPGVSIHPDNSAVLDSGTGLGYASFGEFAGRAKADFSESVSAFPVAVFGGATTSSSNRAIFTRIINTATASNEGFFLARTGDPAPGANGALFTAFTGLLVPDTTSLPVVVARLRSAPGSPVTKANDTGVWGDDGHGVFSLLLRTGDSLAGAAPPAMVKAITLPQTVPGSPAERRHESGPSLLPLVTFTDNSKGIVSLTPDEPPAIVARTGVDDAQGRELLALRFADFSVVGSNAMACFFGQWRPGKGGVTVNDDTAILLSDGATQTVLAREGDEPPGIPGAQFASFNDPLAADEADTVPYVAFDATIRGGGASNSTNRGLWVYPRDGMDPPYLLARSGDAAPGTNGAVFDKFDTMAALTDLDMGIAFTATIRGGDAGKANNYGLWANDNGGAPVLLFRTGQQVAARNLLRTVKAFTVMKAVPVSPGQGRATSTGVNAIALRVELTDRTTAVLTISPP